MRCRGDLFPSQAISLAVDDGVNIEENVVWTHPYLTSLSRLRLLLRYPNSRPLSSIFRGKESQSASCDLILFGVTLFKMISAVQHLRETQRQGAKKQEAQSSPKTLRLRGLSVTAFNEGNTRTGKYFVAGV